MAGKRNYNRGGKNLDYSIGRINEASNFIKYKELFKDVLGASKLIEVSNGLPLIDMSTGTDAVAEIEGNIYGISLRVRNKDYNSFTLNRNILDHNSEVNKWVKNRSNRIKPAYHIQLAKNNLGYKVIRINIDVIAIYLMKLINNNTLEDYYNSELQAYEFTLNDEIINTLGITVFQYKDKAFTQCTLSKQFQRVT